MRVAILFIVTAACTSASEPPQETELAAPLTESNTEATTKQDVVGAPATHRLRARRSANGRRAIDHFDGVRWATFYTTAEARIPIAMHAVYQSGATIVCVQTVASPTVIDGIQATCAVRLPNAAAFSARGTIANPPSSWLHDVCPNTNLVAGPVNVTRFTLLTSAASTLFPKLDHGIEQLDTAPCSALTWNGTSWIPTAATACSCDQLNGQPCTDACTNGQGTWRGGRCDVTGLPARCDDGDAATTDYCTGDPANLCTHETGADTLEPEPAAPLP